MNQSKKLLKISEVHLISDHCQVVIHMWHLARKQYVFPVITRQCSVYENSSFTFNGRNKTQMKLGEANDNET